jgi:hypothetical protein
VADARVSEVEQVLGGDPGAGGVVQRDAGKGGGSVVEQHGGDPRARRGDHLPVGRSPGPLQQQAVDRAAVHGAAECLVAAGESVDVGEQQHVPRLRRGPLRAEHDLAVQRVRHVVHGESERAGAVVPQRPRRVARGVVEVARGGEHPFPGLGPDLEGGIGVEDPGDDRRRHPRPLCDRGDADPQPALRPSGGH